MFNRDAQLFGQEISKARSVPVTLGRFWHYFKDYKVMLAVVIFFIIVTTLVQVAVPILIGQAVDCYLTVESAESAQRCFIADPLPTTPQEKLRGLGTLVSIMAVAYVLSALLSGRQFHWFATIGFKVLHRIRLDVFRQLQRLSLGYYSRNKAGDLMSRLTNDIDTIQQMVGFPFLSTIQSILTISLIVIAMFANSVGYSLVSLAIVPFMVIALRYFSDQARKAFRVARAEIGSVNADLQENIAAVREVQAFSREDENIAQFREQNAANRDANVRAQAFSSALGPVLETLSYVGIAIILAVGGFFLINDRSLLGTTMSAGLIITFITYMQRLSQPIQQIAVIWANIQSAIAGGERVFDLVDTEPELADRSSATPMPLIQGHVIYRNVWSGYTPDEPVLRGVNIEARPGETVAIVGPTGAGKTTIINLLPRFWDVWQGEILIDGTDIRDVTRESLRSQMGIVLQDTFLFSDTVMNNIRYGKPDATQEEVIAAAKLARAHEFIERLPDGYNTRLGERGSGLSQGQRQLLSIARVALLDPRILILDEATSSVDTRTERQIQAALDELLADRTSFVIAHRLSTIRNADQVLVLQDGELAESGDHDSLMAQQGVYYDLYMSQFRQRAELMGEETVSAD